MIPYINPSKYSENELNEPYYTCTGTNTKNAEITYNSSKEDDSSNIARANKLIISKAPSKYNKICSNWDVEDIQDCWYSHRQNKMIRTR